MNATKEDLFEAAAAGDLELLKKNAESLNQKNDRGWTLLHFAARYGQLPVVQYLLTTSCDLSAVNSEGKTADQVAEFWGFDQIAQLIRSATGGGNRGSGESRFPSNRTNFFAGSPLNRYGWYRSEYDKLQRIARSEQSRFILLNELKPLFDANGLYFAKYKEIAGVVDKVYSEAKSEGTKPVPEGDEIILVFLGIDERDGKGENGTSYWALDLTPRGVHEEEFNKLNKGFEARKLEYQPALPRAMTLDKPTAAILAQARAMVDWNTRNQFCPACGRKTISTEAGHKRTCPPNPADGGAQTETPCISQKGIHNFAYPRTDPTIIVCIVHPTDDKILLGRQRKWPGKMFSCIAGFVEAGESVEEAVRREALEETGIIVDRVLYHSSQPWPFPNSLMFGFLAEASTTEIRLEDKELEKAMWYTRAEVLAALNGEPNALFSLPPETAIAHQLIKTWATDKEWIANRSFSPKM